MTKNPKSSSSGLLPTVALTVLGLLSAGWLALFPAYLLKNGTAGPGGADVGLVVLFTLLPLVLIWLVVLCGFVVAWIGNQNALFAANAAQNRRVFEDTEAIGRTVLRAQSEIQRRSDMRVVDLILKDMNAQLALIMERVGMVQPDEMETLWALTAAGNPWVIPSTFLSSAELTGAGFRTIISDRLIADSTATVALQSFLTRYEQMMHLLDIHDDNRLLKEIIGESPYERVIFLLTNILHRLYSRLQARQEELQSQPPVAAPAPMPPAAPVEGPEATGEVVPPSARVTPPLKAATSSAPGGEAFQEDDPQEDDPPDEARLTGTPKAGTDPGGTQAP